MQQMNGKQVVVNNWLLRRRSLLLNSWLRNKVDLEDFSCLPLLPLYLGLIAMDIYCMINHFWCYIQIISVMNWLANNGKPYPSASMLHLLNKLFAFQITFVKTMIQSNGRGTILHLFHLTTGWKILVWTVLPLLL